MTSDLYKRLVARLCGPSCLFPQQSWVRSLGQPESLTGRWFGGRTLHPEQLVLLNQGLPRVLLYGDITDMLNLLQLTATEWLRDNNAVYVVSTCTKRHYEHCHFYLNLQKFIKTSNQLRLLKYDFDKGEDVEKAVNDLSQVANKNHFYVIAASVYLTYWSVGFKILCETLLRQVPDLHLWAAGFMYGNFPSGWKTIYIDGFEDFAKPVRLASGVPSAVLSCHIIGQDHPQGSVHDCEQCGKELATFLRSLAHQEHLKPTDVLLMWDKYVRDDAGFVTGLRSEDVADKGIKKWWGTFTSVPIYDANFQEIARKDIRVVVYLNEDTSDMEMVVKKVTWQCKSHVVIVTHSQQPGRCVQSLTCGQQAGRSGLSPFVRQQTTSCKQPENFWMKWVENTFPDLENKAHFVPPVFMNRVPMTRVLAAGEEVLVPREAPGTTGQSNRPALSPSAMTTSLQPTQVQDSDVRDDAATQRVYLCLQKLSESNRQVFVALSQLKFGQYLGEPSYSAAAVQLPSPKNLPAHHPKNWKDGDFDVLIIHRHYGLFSAK